MREILFRGKHVSSGKWIISPSIRQEEDGSVYLLVKRTWYCVDAETVGQYTGLTDKNGNKIFEGDIVKDGPGLFGKVVFATAQDGFEGMSGFMVDDVFDGLQDCNGFWHHVEIIGNIHDNPELLEVTDVDNP